MNVAHEILKRRSRIWPCRVREVLQHDVDLVPLPVKGFDAQQSIQREENRE